MSDTEVVQYRVLSGNNEGEYESALRQTFEFMRRHGRYTARTLNKLLRAADRCEDARTGRMHTPVDLPVIIQATHESRYDEETEVKYGGALGVVVMWPDDDGKLMIAVHRDFRRKRVGTSLLNHALSQVRWGCTAWLGAENAEGQRFLLAAGWHPTSMNSAGAICYATTGADGVEEQDADVEPAYRTQAMRDMVAGSVRVPRQGLVGLTLDEPSAPVAHYSYGWDDPPINDAF